MRGRNVKDIMLFHNELLNSAAHGDGPIWNEVWALNVPLKVRMFLWRACSNCLPTRDKLHQRRVRVETQCELCLQQAKTAHHILWECPFAQTCGLQYGMRGINFISNTSKLTQTWSLKWRVVCLKNTNALWIHSEKPFSFFSLYCHMRYLVVTSYSSTFLGLLFYIHDFHINEI